MIKKRKLRVWQSIFILALALTLNSDAEARIKVKKLDANIIKAFIQKTSDITSGQDLQMSQSQIQAFLKRHLHKDSRFKSSIQYDIPGFPAQANSIALNKEQFMKNIAEGSQTLEEYYNEVEILDIQISSDKRKATVKTIGTETGVMIISPDGASEQRIPIEGHSTCNQIITISKRHVVQMYNANCETKISFKEY